MEKKVLYILLLISSFILIGCKSKNTSSKKSDSIVGSTITIQVENIQDLSELQIYPEFKPELHEDIEVKVLEINDNEETIKIKPVNTKKGIEFNVKTCNLNYDYNSLLAITKEIIKYPKTAQSILSNFQNKLTVSQATELTEQLFGVLPEDFFSYNDNNYNSSYESYRNYSRYIIEKIENLRDAKKTTTPLHLIAEKYKGSLAKSLLNYYRSYLDIQDENGKTPLMRAIEAENLDVCKIIYQTKPSTSIKDDNGKSFYDYSKESKNEAIKNLFSIYEINIEDLKESLLPLLNELSFSESFKLSGLHAIDIPYTIYSRASEKNLKIKANSKDDFITELAVQESMYQSSDLAVQGSTNQSSEPGVYTGETNSTNNSNSNNSTSMPLIKNTAFVYGTYDDGNPDLETKLKLRDTPSTNGKEKGVLTYGTKVSVIEKSENTDVIGNVSDYWYKVKANGLTGWCFGGFLAVPVVKKDINYLEKRSEVSTFNQAEFRTGQRYSAVLDCKIYGSDNKVFDVKPMEEIEILASYLDNSNEPQFVSYGSYYFGGFYNSYTKYPFYLVRSSRNDIGIISGENLAHRTIEHAYNPKIANTDICWFASYKSLSGSDYYNYADVYEYNSSTKKARKYEFGTYEGLGVKLTDFYLGNNLVSYRTELPAIYVSAYLDFNHKQEIYEGPNAGNKVNCTLYTLSLITSGSMEMGDGETDYYSIFTVTDYHAIKTWDTTINHWRTNSSSGNGRIYFSKENNGKIKACKNQSYYYEDYDGREEGTTAEYFEWDDYTFKKTGEEKSNTYDPGE